MLRVIGILQSGHGPCQIVAIFLTKGGREPVRPHRGRLIHENRGDPSAEFVPIALAVSLVGQLDEAGYGLGVQHVHKMIPVLVALYFYLNGDQELVQPLGQRHIEHRRWLAGEIAFLIVGRQARVEIGIHGQDGAHVPCQIHAPFPICLSMLKRIRDTRQNFAPWQRQPDPASLHNVGLVKQIGGIVLRAAQHHLTAGDTAGVRILIVQVHDQAVLPRRCDGAVHHFEERRRQIWLLQSLAWMDEKALDTLRRHLLYLPADLVSRQRVVPKPEGVETRRKVGRHLIP